MLVHAFGGDGLLRRSEWHSAFADKLMQPRFDAVFQVWGRTRFDPQVAGIVRIPAKFKWHKMVVLNVFQRASALSGWRPVGRSSPEASRRRRRRSPPPGSA
jgi:hypothetical protein